MRNPRVSIILISIPALFAFCTPSASAQEVIPSTTFSRGDAQHITCETHIPPIRVFTVAPKPTTPYSATEESSSLQTLADGTHITHKPNTSKIYRDSLGRSRTERNICGPNAADDPNAIFVVIRDPVEGVAYVLDLQNHIAHRFTAEARPQITSSAAPSPSANGKVQGTVPGSMGTVVSSGTIGAAVSGGATVRSANPHSQRNAETQPLGTQVIEGLSVEGTRTIDTIPVDAEGNDRPIQIVTESWHSPDLKMNIFTKTIDPRSGEHTFRLTDISLSEPDPALFRPPGDFKVVDDTETVTIQYSR